MSLLWAVGPLAAVIAGALVVVGLRRTAAAADEIVGSVERFQEVGESLGALRRATDGTAERVGRIRDR